MKEYQKKIYESASKYSVLIKPAYYGRTASKCKYCAEGPVIVMNYDKREAKLYSEHLRHKHVDDVAKNYD